MRLAQRTALPMFEERGFDAVTVNEIATAVGTAASTIYRHFTTKEAIVLWDEHDAALDKAFEHAFRRLPPFEAIRKVFVESLGSRYDEDLDFQLRRVQYIYRTEALHAASGEADWADTKALSAGLEEVLSPANRSAAPVLAGASMVALDAALERWQAGNASTSLGELIGEAFDALSSLGDLR
jgi:AcrR family transcriptional regulator